MCRAAFVALLACLAAGPGATAGEDEDALWRALAEGRAFAMMRHAVAPGTGDPAHFDVDDCATQRNLSDEGRDQARAIGEKFRSNGIAEAAVHSSAWCRCRETAELLGLGPVATLEPLNSFFGRRERREPQTRDLEAWLSTFEGSQPLVLVTHQVNISALTGVYPASGETVVVSRGADGTLHVIGTF